MFRTLPPFEYLSPETLKETFALLKEHGKSAKVLAGGTDLIPQMKWGECRPDIVITLNRIPDLDGIEFDEKTGLKLGALCRIAQIEKSEILRRHYPLLPHAASLLACREIRNRGTVGGNLCTAAPSADMPPSLLALQASAVIGSEKGERVLPLESFFIGPKKSVLRHDEMLIRLELPPMQPNSAGEYIKFGRRNAMEIAMIGAAAVLTFAPDREKCLDAKLALATAAPTPMRAAAAEKLLTNSRLDADLIEEAAQRASKEASPRSSWRTSGEYRREIIPVLMRRAILNARNKIRH